jgi:integrase
VAHSFEFALLTGTRRKEIVTLKWSDYSREQNALKIIRHKTGTVTVFAPLPARVIEILKIWRALGESEFIFSKGRHATNAAYRILKFACLRLKIPYGRFTSGGFVAHDARHNFVTNLMQNNIDIETIKSLSGHSTSSMVMNYSHSSAESRRKAIDAIDGKTDNERELKQIFECVRSGKMTFEQFAKKLKKYRL